MIRTLPAPRTLPQIRWGVLLDGMALAFLVAAWLFLQRFIPDGGDAHAYWLTRSGIHYGTAGTPDAYLYSPLFAQAIRPLTLLGWPTFYAVWTGLLIGSLVYLARPIGAALLLCLPLVAAEVVTGNIHLFLAVAIVLALRHPAAWSAVLLTKITPGVGMIWHLVRREWRALAIVTAVTLGLVIASFLLDPAAWLAWPSALLHSPSTPGLSVPVPLVVRLPLAAALVAIGAVRGWRWTVIVAAAFAVPVLWNYTPLILLGCLRLPHHWVVAFRSPRRKTL